MNILGALLCVFLFSLTAPFTRVAALAVSANTVILLRILGAAVVCIIFVLADKWYPTKRAWKGIFTTAIGILGFNSFMAFGLKLVPSGHAAVALAGLPMATSVYAIIRDGVKPGLKFWIFSLVGTLLCFCFFFFMNVENVLLGDLYLMLAVFSGAFGYVEGGRTSREFGGSRTMSWAVLVSLPLCLPLAYLHFQNTSENYSSLGWNVWFAITYLAVVSQSLGMFLWFKVLAKGPMEKVAMVQLLQPFFTLLAAIYLLSENVPSLTWLVAVLVAFCVLGTNKEKQKLNV